MNVLNLTYKKVIRPNELVYYLKSNINAEEKEGLNSILPGAKTGKLVIWGRVTKSTVDYFYIILNLKRNQLIDSKTLICWKPSL